MHRRDVLRRLALGGVGAATLPLWIEQLNQRALACARHAHAGQAAAAAIDSWTPRLLTAHQNETVVVLSELIIPQTDTAGARAARVNEFIDTVLADAPARERQPFLDGLRWVDDRSRELFGTDFSGATPEQQTALLTIISSDRNRALGDRIGVEFFKAIKALTITGYYSSEIGMREELDDDGNLFFLEFEGCTHPEHQEK
jgi:gluconate 2-dehydrogenase gamma chain